MIALYQSLSPQQNRKPRDEEIKSQYIKYVNLEGQLQGTYPLKKILSSFDRKKYWLVQVSPDNAALSSKNPLQQLSQERRHQEQKEIPICKLIKRMVGERISTSDKILNELSEFAKDIKEPKWIDGSVTVQIQGKINVHKDFPTGVDCDVDDVDDSAIDTNFALEDVKEK
ncbi:hypothetical protein GLOIN_2v1526574 [Rhizophagus irregularis DAOM 181602=DAOM 197198]|nr:hypothetical protein GLOIN_2v1526574 [Rhizophagus irregularis DAOM 181602=DAOM 197198]